MKKLFYWLSPLIIIILFFIMDQIDSPKVNFNFRNIFLPYIALIFAIGYFTLTTISFRKLINYQSKKFAWVLYPSYTSYMFVTMFISVLLAHSLFDYDFGCTDFMCGIEIIFFPLGTLFWGGILNLIMVLTRRMEEPTNPSS